VHVENYEAHVDESGFFRRQARVAFVAIVLLPDLCMRPMKKEWGASGDKHFESHAPLRSQQYLLLRAGRHVAGGIRAVACPGGQ
jgi:hypothetical protein